MGAENGWRRQLQILLPAWLADLAPARKEKTGHCVRMTSKSGCDLWSLIVRGKELQRPRGVGSQKKEGSFAKEIGDVFGMRRSG
jgi:hypothetical protein